LKEALKANGYFDGAGEKLPRISVKKIGEGREPWGDPYWIYADEQGRQAKLTPDRASKWGDGTVEKYVFEQNLIEDGRATS